MPVVVIVILGTRVTVDGEAIYHDGSRPLGNVAAGAVAELFARPLGRPVRAVASDQAGTCTLVVHPNGTWTDVAAVTSTESEHFPESGVATVGPLTPSLPGAAVSHSAAAKVVGSAGPNRRHKVVAAVAVAALFVVAAGVAGQFTRSDPPGLVAEPPPPANTTSTVPTPPETPPDSAAYAPTEITGFARQRPGGPVRLTIRSSVAPLSVDVVLLARGSNEPVRRKILIPSAAQGTGRSVQVFAELEPQVYEWQLSAAGKVVTGQVRVRAAAPVEPPAAELVPTTPVEPTPAPTTPSRPPSKPPPSGPRGNQPIPPTPQR